jgi:ABC-type multidrug transport system ATPase subunit
VAPATGDKPILSVRGLTRSFGDQVIVRDLDLHVIAGERVALRGPNGSGKTTILRCVTGALIPSAGEVEVGGHRAGTRAANRLLGASLSQERSFYLRLSGRDNLLFFARLRHGTNAGAMAQVRALEEELEIERIAVKRMDSCSTGMMQQVALARALLGEPRLFVLDEPTRSLDAEAKKRLWAALDRRPDTAVVIATHLPDDLEHCGRHVDVGA